jgi:hypothetical protein
MAHLEQDKHALLEPYTGILLVTLDALDSAERHRVYKMLKMETAIDSDGSLEVSRDAMSVCEMETSSV